MEGCGWLCRGTHHLPATLGHRPPQGCPVWCHHGIKGEQQAKLTLFQAACRENGGKDASPAVTCSAALLALFGLSL